MGKFRTFWLVFCVVIIASFLRLYHLTTVPPGLYPDEAMNGNNALEALRAGGFSAGGGPVSGFKVFYPENNGREGLFINIQAVFLKLFGVNEPWVLRLPSAIFGILTVLGIYFLTRELFKRTDVLRDSSRSSDGLGVPPWRDPSERERRAAPAAGAGERQVSREISASELRGNEILALLAAFLLATNFWHINFSRIGFRAIMAPLLLVWALYFLLKAVKNPDSRFYILNSTFSGVLFGLGFYTYIAYRVMPVLILAILIYYWIKSRNESWQNKFMLSTCLFLLAAFIVALPLGIYYLQNPADFLGRTSQVSVFSSAAPVKDLMFNILKTAGMFNFVGDWNWRHNYAGRPELFWPVGILFLIGIVVGIKTILERFKPQESITKETPNPNEQNPKQSGAFGFWILFLWFILAAIPVVISNEGLPHALRAILMLPPVIILAAIGGIRLYEIILAKLRNSTKVRNSEIILKSGIFLILSLFVLEAYGTYFVLWAKNPNTADAFSADYVALGRTLNQLPPETPKYVIVLAGGVPVRGIPMPTQTAMFITNTYSPEGREMKNIHYVSPEQENSIPMDALKFYIR